MVLQAQINCLSSLVDSLAEEVPAVELSKGLSLGGDGIQIFLALGGTMESVAAKLTPAHETY